MTVAQNIAEANAPLNRTAECERGPRGWLRQSCNALRYVHGKDKRAVARRHRRRRWCIRLRSAPPRVGTALHVAQQSNHRSQSGPTSLNADWERLEPQIGESVANRQVGIVNAAFVLELAACVIWIYAFPLRSASHKRDASPDRPWPRFASTPQIADARRCCRLFFGFRHWCQYHHLQRRARDGT